MIDIDLVVCNDFEELHEVDIEEGKRMLQIQEFFDK